ncbi:MAG: ABC transporter ATP-binding protein [Nitrososphaerales archaeon]
MRISELSVEYQGRGNNRVLAVDNASLSVPKVGYTLAVVGESGSGKTTLGMSLMNLIESPGRITHGRIEFAEKNILDMDDSELRRFRWREVSMIHQSAMNSLNPVETISGHIVEVLREHTDATKSEAKEKASNLLGKVGIKEERIDDFPHEFSGGMRQRVVIAMALALSPKLLIADEPTSALDVVVQKQILALLQRQVKERNLSLLFITHEIALLKGLVEEVAVMFRGEIVEKGPTSKVLFGPLHPYTEMLLGSLLTLDSGRQAVRGKRITREETEESGLGEGDNYCKYAGRCKYVFDRCRRERPVLTEVETGRWVACHKYA